MSDLVDSQPVLIFNCLDCGAELTRMNRRHLLRMHRSLKELRSAEIGDDSQTDLLCKRCIAQRADHAEDQRRLDDLRQKALIAEYRGRPYAERRQSKEWTILKRQVHRRDGYRCRLCGRDDVELHVHHCTYENYAQEELEDLITLCTTCATTTSTSGRKPRSMMTRQPDLDGVRIKFDRAKHHFRDLQARYERFQKAEAPTELLLYDEPDTGDLVHRVEVSDQPPHYWSAIAGDCVHNLRSSLDLLVCEMVRAEEERVTDRDRVPHLQERQRFSIRSPRQSKGNAEELRWT